MRDHSRDLLHLQGLKVGEMKGEDFFLSPTPSPWTIV
jgi:hypothetical protein